MLIDKITEMVNHFSFCLRNIQRTKTS